MIAGLQKRALSVSRIPATAGCKVEIPSAEALLRAGVLLVQKQENPVSVGGVLGGLLGRLGESPKESILGTITDFVDPQKNHRIYIGTVAVGGTTFHCHSAVHEAQVRGCSSFRVCTSRF